MPWTLLLGAALAAEPETEPPSAVPPANAASAARAGALLVDAHVPVEILVRKQRVAQLYWPGQLALDASTGPLPMDLVVSGTAHHLDLDIPPVGQLWVIVGRTGITTSAHGEDPEEVAPAQVPVEFRVTADAPAQVRMDDQRYVVAAEGTLSLPVAPGNHTLSVRSGDGTVIWASGTLQVTGGKLVIVRVSEGRMPEVAGRALFVAGGG